MFDVGEVEKLKLIDDELPGLTKGLQTLKMDQTDASKVDFVCAILLGNRKLLSGMNLDFDGTIEETFASVFNKPELRLVV